MSRRHTPALETVSLTVPEEAREAYESAISVACSTVGLFLEDEARHIWRVEGVKPLHEQDDALTAALALAAAITGIPAKLQRATTQAKGWLSRMQDGFPEQHIGRRFVIRGTHLPRANRAGRVTLTIDAGLAFGSGEHGSTRGCLRALERVAYRRPARIMDMGCGSGILAMGAAALLHKPVDAIDNDPWSIRVTRENAALNGLKTGLRPRLGNGWHAVPRGTRYNLVFANILARPLCGMARQLAAHLAPGATVILAGLLVTQIPMIVAAHRRQGMRLERVLREGPWATLSLLAKGE